MYRSDCIQCGSTIAGPIGSQRICLWAGSSGIVSYVNLEKIGIHTVGIDPKKSRRDFATSLGFEKIVDFTETEGLI